MEEKIKAIVISGKDYKEKDKQIVLFSLEKGKIYANLRGVRLFKAKMKTAKELFAFGDYIITDGGTVTSFSPIDNFYDITSDYDKYINGCVILQILNTVLMVGESNVPLFLETLNSLKCLAYDKVCAEYVTIKFLIKIFESLGYKLSLKKCACCGGEFINKRFLNLDSGEVVCFGCKGPNCLEISNSVHSALRILSETPYEKLSTLKLAKGVEKETLEILKQNFERRFSKKLF